MAATFPPKISPVLMTPDPHYIPGYGGFCPQFKYNLGKTYGKLTADLLTSPDIRRSGQLVLQSCPFPPPRTDSHIEAPTNITKRRRARLGDQKLSWSMIPGYTGFIPRSQKFFAKTYAETSRDALTDFQKEQYQQESQRQQQMVSGKLQSGQQLPHTEQEKQLITAKYRTPLPPLNKEAAPYVSPAAYQEEVSPYYMEDENPHKYFISGYTGYVPRSRFLIGNGYPLTTNRAMVEFGHMTLKKSARVGDQPQLREENKHQPDEGNIYLESLGLLPRYTGYVPGYKFQYGHTYGHLTQNALGESTLQKQMVN
ncbi:ciliary microtubule inner protein 2B isoform X2 [Hyperolius riggenbachi]|uniref:ciliary microtubule inner protein 2B isoform X2 n=1 Tax=Hyperolius riggenbachi TaxID=752182 RepID=UPI0035A321F2